MPEVFQSMKSFVTTDCRMFVAPEISLLDKVGGIIVKKAGLVQSAQPLVHSPRMKEK